MAEFYANCKVANRVLTSKVNGKKLRFDAKKMGEILGALAIGFDVYVHEDNPCFEPHGYWNLPKS